MTKSSRIHKLARGVRCLLVAALVLSLLPTPALHAAGGAPLAERPPRRNATAGAMSTPIPTVQPTRATPDAAPGLRAVEIVATKRDALHTDVDADGVADPGDTVRYTIVVRNQGSTDAADAVLTDTLDAHTTLSGAAKTTPLARPDAYTATGNTTLTVDALTGLLANDSDPDGSGALTISDYDTTSVQGGQVSVNTITGAFTYNPPVGYEGADSFSYTIRDVDGNTDATTVTLTVTEMVWYINNTAGAGGDGRYATPFNSLTAFNTAQTRSAANDPEAGDIIFIYQGSGAYTNGITLKPNQQLIGQGENLVVNGQTIAAAAGDPIITNTTAANGGHGIVLAAGNTVRGLTVGNTNDAGIWGSTVGMATVSNVVINGTGKILAISGGTLAMTFDSLATSSAAGPAISLSDLTNTSALTSNSTTLSGVAGDGIILQDSAGATLNLGAASISLNGAGDGIEAVTDVSGASLICASLAITTTSGRGIAAGNGLNISVGGSSSTINAVGGAAIEASSSTINGVFSSVSSSGGSYGLSLTYHTGTLTMNGGAISGASSRGVYVSGGSGAITYAGSVTATAGRSVEIVNRTGGAVTLSGAINDTATGILVNNNTGGAITFSGATKTVNTGTNAAVSLTSNTGATISFTNGGLDIDTTSGAGINVTGGGTLVISGENNTINTTTGTSVNIANTTIGAGGVTLRSVSANGAANAIVLNNTGSNAFTITGDGSLARNGSGGVIQNTTGDGVSLTSAQNVTLRSINIQNTAGDAIESSGGANITLSAVTIQNPTGNGWLATNLTGSSNRIDNNSLLTQINGANKSAVYVANTSTVLGSLTFNNSTFSSQSSTNGQGYVILSGMGTAVMTLNVENNCQFTGLYGSAIIANAGNSSGSTATINLNIADSDFINAAANGLGDIEMMALQGGTMNFDISNNTLNNIGIPLAAVGVINIQAMDSGKLNGTVDYNAISNVTGYIGIRVNSTMTAGPHNVTIDHNTLTNIGREGVYVYCFDNTADMDVWITNNTIGTAVAPVGTTAREGIEVRSGDVSGYSGPSQLDIVIQNNQVVNNAAADQTLDLDCEDGGVLNATVKGNTLQNLAGGGPVMTADTEQAGCNLCLDLDNNTASGGDSAFTLTEYSGSNFTLYNLATVSARNTGTVSVGAGIVESGGSCSQPVAMMMAAQPAASASVAVEATSDERAVASAPENAASQLERETPDQAEPVSLAESPLSTRATILADEPGLAAETVGASLLSGETVNVAIGALPAGKAITITFDVVIDASFPASASQISNQGRVGGSNFTTVFTDDPDTGATNDATLTDVPQADLVLAKLDAPDPVIAGEMLTYTLVITNTGPSTATGVIVTDVLPTSVNVTSASSSQGSFIQNGDTVIWTVGVLTASASATGVIRVTVAPTQTGVLTNTAQTTGDQHDPDMANNDVACTTLAMELNDPPVNTVPGSFTEIEDTNHAGLVFSIADEDAGASAIQFTLSASHGSLTLATTSGLTFAAGANGTHAMTCTGTLTATNAALNGVIYRGDADYSGADVITLTSDDLGHTGTGGALSDTDVVTVTLLSADTTTVLLSSSASSVYGQAITFTAAVTSGVGVPMGAVVFRDGSTTLHTTALVSGVATFTTSLLAVGVHTVTATYAGENPYNASSDAIAHTVQKASTTLALASSANSPVCGQGITLTATVLAAAPSAGVASGVVTFREGTVTLGSASLAGGAAHLAISNLAVGAHTIVAEYAGNSSFNGANNTITQTVGKAASVVTLTSAPNPSAYGADVMLAATVAAAAPGAGAPSGSVTFREGAVTLGSAPVVAGVATLSVSNLGVGAHTLTATYGGDGCFQSSGDDTAHTVSQMRLGLTKTDSRTTWYAGWNWNYTLIVTNTNATPVTGAWLTDVLPAGLTLVSAPPGATQNADGSLTWSVGTLAAGESRTYNVWVRTMSTARGVITNVANLTCDGGLPATASDVTTIVAAPAEPTPTPTRTVTPTRTATPTLTPTPTATPADLVISGVVYERDRELGAGMKDPPLAGATVRAIVCGVDFVTVTDDDGRYELVIPASALQGCETLTLEVSAEGYRTLTRTLTIAELRAQPQQDFTLYDYATVWLPTLMK